MRIFGSSMAPLACRSRQDCDGESLSMWGMWGSAMLVGLPAGSQERQLRAPT